MLQSEYSSLVSLIEPRLLNGRLGQGLLETVDRQVASDAGGGELRRHGDLLAEDPLDDCHALGPHPLPNPESLTDQVGVISVGSGRCSWKLMLSRRN